MGDWPIGLEEACRRLGCSERWLRGHLRQHGCHRRAGRRILFTEADFAELVKEAERDA